MIVLRVANVKVAAQIPSNVGASDQSGSGRISSGNLMRELGTILEDLKIQDIVGTEPYSAQDV